MNSYTINIKHCNSISKADISLYKGRLNIKYGPNGIGKSTISRSIMLSTKGGDALGALTPFATRAANNNDKPQVLGCEDIKSVLLFDDEYVSQFAFQQDEVVKNSFEIFINNDEYRENMKDMEDIFLTLKEAFQDNPEIKQATTDLADLREAFTVTKSGAISKSSKGFKAFGLGNKIENIPATLEAYTDFLKSDQPASWIAWQAKGAPFSEMSDRCPYCSTALKQEEKAVVKSVAEEYDSKSVEHLSTLQAIIRRLGKYLENDSRETLLSITKSKLELSKEELNFLASLRGDVETLLFKLEALQRISFYSLRDVDKIEDEIKQLKINLAYMKNLASQATLSIVDPINGKIDGLIVEVSKIKAAIGKQKSKIAKIISGNQDSINGFLRSAGYRYRVSVQGHAETYMMRLSHIDYGEHLDAASRHLSYGEKNAFALVLFMYQVLREKPDLAVLDDPVSSFDDTKKFAIFHRLFRGPESLRNQTVLMLTHDLEPAIDIIRSLSGKFQASDPAADFLSARAGVITEIAIERADIKTFAEICRENVVSIEDALIKCIYLRRRFELLGEKGFAYNLLSSLLHGRDIPTTKSGELEKDMSPEQIAIATKEIQDLMPSFNYSKIRDIIINKDEVVSRYRNADVGYDKLQIYRILQEIHGFGKVNVGYDDIFLKFINETFHIENEYVMQLNPHKFDNVPEYIVMECDRLVGG